MLKSHTGHGFKGRSPAVPIANPPRRGGDWSSLAHRVMTYGFDNHKAPPFKRRIATPRVGDGPGSSHCVNAIASSYLPRTRAPTATPLPFSATPS